MNAGQAEMNWRAETNSLGGGNWLVVSPASGTTAAGSSTALTLTARPAGLATGMYSALVTISAPNTLNSPQIVLAQMAVQAAGTTPTGFVRPGGMALVTSAGGAAQRGSFTVSTSGGTALSFVAAASTTDGVAWLSVSPFGGSLRGSADQATLTAQASTTGLAAGVYRGRVNVAFSTGVTQDASVLFVVTPAGAGTSGGGEAGGAPSPHQAGSRPAAACTPAKQYPVHTALVNNFSLPSGWATPILVRVLDDCGTAVSSSTVVATFSNGDDAVGLRSIGSGLYSGMWNPGKTGSATVSVLASGSGLQQGRADPVTCVVASASGGARAPLIFRNGAVSGASFKRYAPLAPGQIFSLFGSNFAGSQTGASAIPLPLSLAGVSAKLAGTDVPLYYADGGQVNAQVPFELAAGGTFPLLVQVSAMASPPELVTLAPVQPAIFTVNSSGSGAGVITDANGALIDSANPAKAGQVVIIYATGLGATNPTVRTGEASPSNPPAAVTQSVTAYVGGSAATVEFAGLTPGLVGLYQVNVRIPDNASAGDAVELYLEQGQASSNKVTLAIR